MRAFEFSEGYFPATQGSIVLCVVICILTDGTETRRLDNIKESVCCRIGAYNMERHLTSYFARYIDKHIFPHLPPSTSIETRQVSCDGPGAGTEGCAPGLTLPSFLFSRARFSPLSFHSKSDLDGFLFFSFSFLYMYFPLCIFVRPPPPILSSHK